MTRRARILMVGVIAVLPFAASACKVDLGGGCNLLLMEGSVKYGITCS
jgi:hypothetical protein